MFEEQELVLEEQGLDLYFLRSEIARLLKDKRDMANSIISMIFIQCQLISNLPEGDYKAAQMSMQDKATAILMKILEKDKDLGDLVLDLPKDIRELELEAL